MHVRLLQRGRIDMAAARREEHQPAAEMVVLSAHDTELRLLAEAAASRPAGAPSLTLTNYLTLSDPSSIRAYVRETLAGARLVALRLLGGEGYWAEGVEALREWANGDAARILAFVPGGGVFDEEFARRGTLGLDDVRPLWTCLAEGGPANAARALAFLAALLGRGARPGPAEPMPSAGFLTPDLAGAADVLVLFYRALAQAGDTEPVEALASALARRGLTAAAVHAASLKEPAARAFVRTAAAVVRPDAIATATAFAADTHDLFPGVPVLQTAFAGQSARDWRASARGMGPADLAMHVVMPELDGRVFTHPVAFKTKLAWDAAAHHAPSVLQSEAAQVEALADRLAALIRLRRTPAEQRRVAILLANYPNRDGRLANGVGLDTPASCARLIAALAASGHRTEDAPTDPVRLMELISRGLTNASGKEAEAGVAWALDDYTAAFAELPEALRAQTLERWGAPEADPFARDGAMCLALHGFGDLVVGVQPSRGYELDPAATFHDPALPPPHRYIATYLWLRCAFDAHAVVHLGKHGNLEWLPGKAVGLSRACWPAALIGPLPNIYPFIVNDPGEGVQAKRRTAAVIVDHLTPPLARGELHGDLLRLEALVDEYALAADVDPRRAAALGREIASFVTVLRLDDDIDLAGACLEERVRRVDAHLCDLKEMQIRDGLHVFGASPVGRQRVDLAVAIARVPRPGAAAGARSLHRAIAADAGFGAFDPLTRELAAPWSGPRPEPLASLLAAPWRTAGDGVERVEALAFRLVAGEMPCPADWRETRAVLDWIADELLPAIDRCGPAEGVAMLAALAGNPVAPGPSGAPSRGRPEVLPTGRNFYAVDPRAVPTPAAFEIGRASAEALVRRHYAETGHWLRSVALSAWGTANMRTGGDDVAQALALIGCRPVWEPGSGRVGGFEILPPGELKRPRVDVTMRVSGLFRDAFPTQIELFDAAARAVAALDEDELQNPIAAAARRDAELLRRGGASAEQALRQAAARVFGSMPGAYGAGLQAPIDTGRWETRDDLAEAYLAWSGFAYGGGADGSADQAALRRRLAAAEAVLQAQDNREHDILDSDDYYQFMGGLAASVAALSGRAPKVYHTDTSRSWEPVVRTLGEEISRVVRGRAANPKWIAGAMRHGFKGAFEMAATVDYLFAFAATTDAVKDHHFDQLFAAYVGDDRVRSFLADANPAALAEMAARFAEAIRRGLWRPRANDVQHRLKELAPP